MEYGLMKFIIWGAGLYGRRARKFFEGMVVAFIDAKSSLQGTMMEGMPIYSYEDCRKKGFLDDPEVWIVVTPRHFVDSIVSFLQAHQMQRYFVLFDAARNFYDASLQDILQVILKNHTAVKVEMEGFDCLHAMLYEKLLEAGKHPVIWISEENWEREAGRIACLNWDIRRGDGACSRVVQDAKILARTENIYENPALKKFHDMFAGRRCFIVATGPSLRMEDLETLRKHGELCISMNGIYHAFPQVKWRPDFFVMIDLLVDSYWNIIDHMTDVPYKLIGDSKMSAWSKKHPDGVYRLHFTGGDFTGADTNFSDDLVQGAYANGTVTNVCIQLAVYLGCKEIYLLGVDFYNVLPKEGRVSHFTDDYDDEMGRDDYSECYTDEFSLKLMGEGYRISREYADAHPPLKIYNATRGGYLEVFERVDFDSLF